jgi:hypothetical protein
MTDETKPPRQAPVFASFFQGGFECSTHRRPDRRRLDIIAATKHDELAESDYRLMASLGIRTIRDGLRWHLIDKGGSHYDWSGFLPMLRAAKAAQVQVIWDVFHYGWPDDIDVWTPAFVDRFAAFAGAAAKLIRNETDEVPLYSPVNEISFVAWAGGDAAVMNPFANYRGGELKAQLIRASIAATEAIWDVDKRARIMQIDPMINALPHADLPSSVEVARNRTAGQFEAWDMLKGACRPGLGGQPKYLDVIGINFYPHNQWIEGWGPLHWTSGGYLPFRHILMENYRRYGRPLFIAETGIEAERRPQWLRYVCGEVAVARAMGVPVEGICLYPIMNHPGWLDERHCPNGLIDYCRDTYERSIYEPLAKELAIQQKFFERAPRDKLKGAIIPLETGQTFDDPTATYHETPYL